MAYRDKTYTLREESTGSGKRYFISFKDGQGERHELEVSEQLFIEFRGSSRVMVGKKYPQPQCLC